MTGTTISKHVLRFQDKTMTNYLLRFESDRKLIFSGYWLKFSGYSKQNPLITCPIDRHDKLECVDLLA
jgi:hypothetical protein